MSVVLINQEIVHYEVLGRGRPVIFLHSWVGSWRYWIPTLQAASTDYRAYALDLWGFGETSRTVSNFSVEKQVELLDNFLYQMGMGKIALVGHGFGAIVALQFAAQNPRLVDRILTVAYPMREADIQNRLRTDPSLVLAGWLTSQRPELAPVVEDSAKIEAHVAGACWEGIHDERLQALWRRNEMMCLMVQGMMDPAVKAADEEALRDVPEKTKLMVFTESGHFPMLDEAEKFHRLMAEFLGLPSGQNPRGLQITESWKRRVR